jgi:hypothetical protein
MEIHKLFSLFAFRLIYNKSMKLFLLYSLLTEQKKQPSEKIKILKKLI